MNIQTARPETAVRLRRAKADDATAISKLYVEAYTPVQGGEACDHYPFPQVLDPSWVADAVAQDSIVWGVAESEGRVAASAAALRNIGGVHDQVAEVFGVVVAAFARKAGLGTKLLTFVCDELGSTGPILCEARTAEPGGWKVARNCGFHPVGFAPFAHAMPVGFESMILTAKDREIGRGAVTGCRLRPSVRRLASAVVGEPMSETAPVGCDAPLFNERSYDTPLPTAESGVQLQLSRNDVLGQRLFHDLGSLVENPSGIVNLHPLKGCDGKPDRCTTLYYLAFLDRQIVGSTRIVWDRTDCRARILGMHLQHQSLESQFVLRVLEELDRSAQPTPLTVVINVRCDALETQRGLEAAGFFPTAYCRNLVKTGAEYVNVVQYTCLRRHRLEDIARFASSVDWPSARAIIDGVMKSAVANAR